MEFNNLPTNIICAIFDFMRPKCLLNLKPHHISHHISNCFDIYRDIMLNRLFKKSERAYTMINVISNTFQNKLFLSMCNYVNTLYSL